MRRRFGVKSERQFYAPAPLPISARIDGRKAGGEGALWTPAEEVESVGLPTVMKKVVQHIRVSG